MGWRVTIELNDADGTKQTHEVAGGGGTDPHSPLDPLGLTLDDGKTLLAGVQRHLVQGRVAEYSCQFPEMGSYNCFSGIAFALMSRLLP
jgi:hypothetical protein